MGVQIHIAKPVFERLQSLAIPLVDTPETVIERLISYYEATGGSNNPSKPNSSKQGGSRSQAPVFQNDPSARNSRERGVIVKIGNQTLKAHSVSDLYEKVLISLHESGSIERLRSKIPFATSRVRYLVASKPTHPNAKPFVVPVAYRGIYMEAHKDYKNAVNHLRKWLECGGITLTYIG